MCGSFTVWFPDAREPDNTTVSHVGNMADRTSQLYEIKASLLAGDGVVSALQNLNILLEANPSRESVLEIASLVLPQVLFGCLSREDVDLIGPCCAV